MNDGSTRVIRDEYDALTDESDCETEKRIRDSADRYWYH